MEALNDQFTKLLDFAKLRKKGSNEFRNLISKRIEAELSYSKSLQNIAIAPLLLNQEYGL